MSWAETASSRRSGNSTARRGVRRAGGSRDARRLRRGAADARPGEAERQQHADDDAVGERAADVSLDQPPVVHDARDAGDVNQSMDRGPPFTTEPPDPAG